jgi:hypothetical protein
MRPFRARGRCVHCRPIRSRVGLRHPVPAGAGPCAHRELPVRALPRTVPLDCTCRDAGSRGCGRHGHRRRARARRFDSCRWRSRRAGSGRGGAGGARWRWQQRRPSTRGVLVDRHDRLVSGPHCLALVEGFTPDPRLVVRVLPGLGELVVLLHLLLLPPQRGGHDLVADHADVGATGDRAADQEHRAPVTAVCPGLLHRHGVDPRRLALA